MIELENFFWLLQREDAPPKSHGVLMRLHHQIQRIRELYCKGIKLPCSQCEITNEERSQMRGYFFFVDIFSRVIRYQTNGPKISAEGLFERKPKVLVSFLSDQKGWRAISHHLTYLFPKIIWSKFSDSHLVQCPTFCWTSWKVQLLWLWGWHDPHSLWG